MSWPWKSFAIALLPYKMGKVNEESSFILSLSYYSSVTAGVNE